MPILLLLLVILLAPSLASAAYLDSATVLRYEQDQNGAARLIMRFQGNAGEPIVDRPYQIASDSTVGGLREWVRGVATELNLARTAGTAPQVASGTVINGAARAAQVVTPRGIWRSKVLLYTELSGKGFIGALGTALDTLKADIEATYQAGYLDVN